MCTLLELTDCNLNSLTDTKTEDSSYAYGPCPRLVFLAVRDTFLLTFKRMKRMDTLAHRVPDFWNLLDTAHRSPFYHS